MSSIRNDPATSTYYLPTHRPANQTGQGTTNPELLRRQRIPTRTTVDSPTSFLRATSRGNYSPYYLPTRPANETGQGTTNPELLGRQRIPARTTVDSLQASRLLPCFSTTKTQTGPCPNSSAGCSELRTTVDSPQTWALCARALNLLSKPVEYGIGKGKLGALCSELAFCSKPVIGKGA